MQRTLRREVTIVGTGLHSGRPVRLRLKPMAANFGVWFRRVDVVGRDNLIAARWDNVFDTRLSTNLRNDSGVEINTVEHLMAAFAGCGVHNIVAEIDGPEVPIMDGSAARFVKEILKAGLIEQGAKDSYLKVLKPVQVQDGLARAELIPFDGVQFDFSITFENTIIGTQSASLNMRNGNFTRELADCRTFCKLSDVEAMRASGRALGGSTDTALVIDGDRYVNPEGPRRQDECVRHKMLDAVGDLALAGLPILGRYRGERAGHRMNNLLLHELFSTEGAFEIRTTNARVRADLPGPSMDEIGLLRVG